MNIADPTHDKGKSALVDKFRDREERWRREQSIHDQQAAQAGQAHKGAVSIPPEAGGPPVEGEATADPDSLL